MTEAETTPSFKIKSLDDLQKIMTIAKGGDPNAIQAIANFMNLKSNTERSYFPDKKTTLCIAQLIGKGKVNFPNDDWDPFTLVSDCVEIAYMAYKGFKSAQFVDMTRQTPNLADLQTSVNMQEGRAGLLNRLLGRGKTE